MIDKQIEEMAKALDDIYSTDFKGDYESGVMDVAEKLYNAGYRKASDVAKKIFNDIENAIGYDFHSGEELRIVFALSKLNEVKRKHLNEDFFIKMTHTCPHIIPHTIESIADIAFTESEGEG